MLLEISKSDIAFGIRVSEFNTETLKETNQDVMHYDILIIYKPLNNLSLNFGKKKFFFLVNLVNLAKGKYFEFFYNII